MIVAFFIIAVILIFIISNEYAKSKPLDSSEANTLAELKRHDAIHSELNFSKQRLPPDVAFKAAMIADGAFHPVQFTLQDSLAAVASHLKHKKHEWIAVLLCTRSGVKRLWLNKGPDRKSVQSKINIYQIISLCKSSKCDLVIMMHNHPNPYGSNISLLGPSEVDLESGANCAARLNASEIDFVDVVCERGRWQIFLESYVGEMYNIDIFKLKIADANGTTATTNKQLRKELAILKEKAHRNTKPFS